MYSIKNILVLLLGLFIPLTYIFAQQDFSANIRHFTTENGLPDNHIYRCFQDRKGLMWFLTGSGLVKFDGQQFQLVVNEGFNTDNSKNDFLFEEPNGDLWIANYIRSDSSSFIIVNTHTGRVSTMQSKFGPQLSTQIQDVRYAGKGDLWASTYQGEIIRIQPGKLAKIIARPFKKGFRFHAVDTLNQTLLIDQPFQNNRDQNIYLIHAGGKLIAKHQIHYLQRIWSSPSGGYQFHNLDYFGWISSKGELKQAPFKQELPDFDAPVFIDNALPLFHDSPNDRYWIFYKNSLRVFHPQSGELQISPKNNQERLPKNAYAVFVDRQGSAWVCTIEGLYQISLKAQRFQKLLWLPPLGAENPVLMSCRGIFKDEKEGILYVTARNCVWAIKKGQAKELLCRPTAFYSIVQDQEQNIWAGCEDLYRYQLKGGHSTTFRQKIPKEFAIAWSLLPQKDRIWLGLSNGLAYFDLASMKLFFVDELNPLLDNAIIHGIEVAGQHQLWLITEKGLILFEPGKGVIAHYWTGAKGKKKLPLDNLRAIYREKNDCWWLASSKGLVKWNPLNGESRIFTTTDGLSNDNIYAVYPDDYGFLWMSSDNGIIQFQKSTFKSRCFLPKDGITHQEFNRISHHQDREGRIYFGSLNGVTSFHPRDFYADFDKNPDIPLLLSNATRFCSSKDTLEEVSDELLQLGKIVLRPAHLYLNLRFALLDYANPNATQYEYQIVGLSNQWLPCTGSSLQLFGLPYGGFKLRVRAKTENGVYSRQELMLPIQVVRPLYAQIWFRLLLLLLIVAGVITFFRYRNHWLKQRKKELEEEVAVQTQKIREDKETIEKQAAELIKLDKAKSRFFANVTHELRTPLTLIHGPLKTYIEQNHLKPDQAEFLYLAKHHTTRLEQMVDDLLDLGKLEAGKLILQESPIVLQHKIEYLLGSFKSLAQSKNIKLELDYKANPSLVLNLDRRLFRMILSNLLSNALKFTDNGGQISLRVQELPEEIQIEVADTGRGIHPDDLPHVFERYFQTQHQETAYEGGTGIGLALARESSKAIGGSLEVKSIWGKGSTFTWRFPKKRIVHSNMHNLMDNYEGEAIFAPLNPPIHSIDPIPLEKANLLLVEDNPDLRQYLSYILNKEYDVIALENGLQAREYLEKNTAPDLIISDIMMPHMDGFQFLEWLKSGDLATLPVIMLTARVELNDKLKALQIGVDDYLVKPFVEEELLTRIQNLLKRQELRRSFDPLSPLDAEEAVSDNEQIAAGATKEEWLQLLEQTVLDQLENPDFSVNDLAKAVFMSRSVFYSEMGRVLGLTPNEYINEVRLLKAMEYFQSNPGVFSVKEMASKVGFRDEKYFSRQFKQRFGVLPSQLR